jgi:hypothetical protein
MSTSRPTHGVPAGIPAVGGIEFPQVAPVWVDTPETWTGWAYGSTHGEQHENR